MPETPSNDIDPRILGLLDELEIARSAYDVAIARGQQQQATACIEKIKAIAARIDQLRFGNGEKPKDMASKYTEH